MVSLKNLARGAAMSASRQLPGPVRDRALALIRGETPAQRGTAQGLRRIASRIHVDGHGDQVAGEVMRPHLAVTVTRFDAWAHLEAMREALVTALGGASVDVFELPNQDTPVLVVSSSHWDTAWRVLSSTPALATFWVDGGSGRAHPVGSQRSAPSASGCRVFQQFRAPGGALVADQKIHVRLQCWALVTDSSLPRLDGGFHEEGTLLAGGNDNTFASYLSPGVQDRIRAVPGRKLDWLPSIEAVTQPVDIVYTWVDGSDPVWLARKAQYEGTGDSTNDSQIAARFQNRDELRYSLRSVEMYAGWHNHIYLVTDGQVPPWLNRNHPRLTVVDHRDLFDSSELPVFNSHAIESRLHRIEGLSEFFVYMNDDFFFGRPVRRELFFTGAGESKYFKSKAHIDPAGRDESDTSVTSAAKNNRKLIEEVCGRTFSSKLKHTPYAHKKSVLVEMEQKFPEVFQGNVSARYRTHDDHSVLSSLAQHYGSAHGTAQEGRIAYNYADTSREDLHKVFNRWLRSHSYDVFCLNDTGASTPPADQFETMMDFLSSSFPLPSSFEVFDAQPRGRETRRA